jgi:hypothetical protein
VNQGETQKECRNHENMFGSVEAKLFEFDHEVNENISTTSILNEQKNPEV